LLIPWSGDANCESSGIVNTATSQAAITHEAEINWFGEDILSECMANPLG